MNAPAPRPIHLWLPALSGSTGGIQAYLQSFLNAYSAAQPSLKTAVFIKNDPGSSVAPGTARMVFYTCGHWPAGPLRTLAFAAKLLWAAWRQKPGLIIVGHANFVRLAIWARRFLGIPFWGIVYGFDVTEAQGAANAARLGQAERIISISRYTRDCLIATHGLSAARFSILPTTFDDRRFRPGDPPAGLREKFGLPPGRQIILTICRLSRAEGYKGYDEILRALLEVRRAVPTAHYLLGGRGDDLPRIRQMVTELGLEDAVTLAGFVAEEDLIPCYQLCDVFAMPSRGEGFGIVFLEALACGRPVLAGNRDGSVDALLDGELGVLVDPEDIAGIAAALVDLLAGSSRHPLVYQPTELHRRVVAAYGPARFAATLAGILDEFLPATVRDHVE